MLQNRSNIIKRLLSVSWVVLSLIIAAKFLTFDVIWCYYTSFAALRSPECWAITLFLATLLTLPYAAFRSVWAQTFLLLVIDGLLVSNLMYYRTYFTAIPAYSYLMVGNLADFSASVWDSLRWIDLLFPTTSMLALCWCYYNKKKQSALQYGYPVALGSSALIVALIFVFQGGYMKSYSQAETSYFKAGCIPAMYSVFGVVLHDVLLDNGEFTSEIENEIEELLNSRSSQWYATYSGKNNLENLVIILAESLESWPIGSVVEGKEITPYLNSLVADSTTLYVPKVTTQVQAARSMDGQLLITTGLMPPKSGPYCSRYASNLYPSLAWAMKSERGAKAELLTVDKTNTWNQGAVALAFGIDSIVSYYGWDLSELAGGNNRFTGKTRLPDRSFLRQAAEKIESRDIWKNRGDQSQYLQLVTYSGHSPFEFPENVKKITFSDTVPRRMADYMSLANYTDEAIGNFIDRLKKLPEYENTLIVITGDHEGLAMDRAQLLNTSIGRRYVSQGRYTPLIVVNSPVGGRVDKVVGQIDVYPTILSLLGLDSYSWKGLGQNILDPAKPDSIENDDMDLLSHVSNMILEYDYFRRKAYRLN